MITDNHPVSNYSKTRLHVVYMYIILYSILHYTVPYLSYSAVHSLQTLGFDQCGFFKILNDGDEFKFLIKVHIFRLNLLIATKMFK